MPVIRKVKDKDPALTMRRILLVINACGETVPQKVVDWIVLSIDGDDGDILKVKAFALKACSHNVADENRVLPHEAVTVIRDVCIRRIGASL